MEIRISLLSLPLSFSPAQLYQHSVYTLSFGRQIVPDEGEAGEDGNLNDIGLWCIPPSNDKKEIPSLTMKKKYSKNMGEFFYSNLWFEIRSYFAP